MSEVAAPEAHLEAPTPEPAEREPAALFRYSLWLHVGPGAAGCSEVDEAEGTNRCGDRSHFHAWCRLPNQFQHREIQSRAMAAKARKMRQLRDPETNANLVLEDGIADLAERGEEAREEMVTELIQVDWWKHYLEAMRATREMPDPAWEPEDSEEEQEPDKLYEHIDDDRGRFALLISKPAEERDEDELTTLRQHLENYEAELNRRTEALQAPLRDALNDRPFDDLLEEVRRKRAKTIASDEFTHTFNVNEWLTCTLTEVNGRPHFAEMRDLEGAPTDVVSALELAFADLERTAQGDSGN